MKKLSAWILCGVLGLTMLHFESPNHTPLKLGDIAFVSIFGPVVLFIGTIQGIVILSDKIRFLPNPCFLNCEETK